MHLFIRPLDHRQDQHLLNNIIIIIMEINNKKPEIDRTPPLPSEEDRQAHKGPFEQMLIWHYKAFKQVWQVYMNV